MSGLFDLQIADEPDTQAKVQQWIEALRSGRYQQGQGALRPTADTYCCLGVAVDLFDGDWIKADDPDYKEFEFKNTNGPVEYAAHTDGDICVSDLPIEVSIDLLMDSGGEGSFGTEDGTFTTLAQLNDLGTPFSEIADVIEREFAEALTTSTREGS